MSLLNKVLKDLAERGEPIKFDQEEIQFTNADNIKNDFQDERPDDKNAGRDFNKKWRNGRGWIIFFITCFILGESGFYVFTHKAEIKSFFTPLIAHFKDRKVTPAPQVLPPKSEEKNEAPKLENKSISASPVAEEKGIVMQGVKVELIQNRLLIHIILNHVTPLYTIDHNNGDDNLIVTLTDAFLGNGADFPASYANFFDNLKVDKVGDDKVILTFHLEKDVQLGEQNMIGGDRAELQIWLNDVRLEASADKAATGNADRSLPSNINQQNLSPVSLTAPTSPNNVSSNRQISNSSYEQALVMINQGNTNDALQVLSRIVSEMPENWAARETLAALLLKENQVVAAQTLIDKGLENNTNYLPFVELKARILVVQNNVPDAIALLEKNIPQINNDPEYYSLLANLYQRHHDDDSAALTYYQLTKLPQAKAEWWIGLGKSLEALSEKNAAKEAYTKALQGTDLADAMRASVEENLRRLSNSK